jgi:nitroimidazol reductase NimA-like FMN-containing flavoprotein (pyridoxamine 5'-phosphate oxidase superfamily)
VTTNHDARDGTHGPESALGAAHAGLEALSRDECLQALGTRRVGRVGITDRAMPVILPVNYALLDGDVVFATETGTKLDSAVLRSIVAFEVDQVDEQARTGWSVCVTGVAEEVVQDDQVERARGLDLQPMVPLVRQRYVRIRSDLISGRRIS